MTGASVRVVLGGDGRNGRAGDEKGLFHADIVRRMARRVKGEFGRGVGSGVDLVDCTLRQSLTWVIHNESAGSWQETGETMTAATDVIPSIETLCAATGGSPSRDGNTVVVSYGRNGYARLTPDYAILNGEHIPAAAIEMNVQGRKGGLREELGAALKAAGIRPC